MDFRCHFMFSASHCSLKTLTFHNVCTSSFDLGCECVSTKKSEARIFLIVIISVVFPANVVWRHRPLIRKITKMKNTKIRVKFPTLPQNHPQMKKISVVTLFRPNVFLYTCFFIVRCFSFVCLVPASSSIRGDMGVNLTRATIRSWNEKMSKAQHCSVKNTVLPT